jgi:hypothetical protein
VVSPAERDFRVTESQTTRRNPSFRRSNACRMTCRMATVTPQTRVLFRQLALAAMVLAGLCVLAHGFLGVVVAWLTVGWPAWPPWALLAGTATLAAGLVKRSESLLIPGFLLSNLCAIVLLPEMPASLLLNGARTGTLLLSLVVYMVAATRWCDRDTPLTPDYEERFAGRPVRSARLVEWRAIASAALLLGPLAAVAWTGDTEPGAQGHRLTLFSSLLVCFLWSVGVYLFLIAPSIAPAADARESHGPWLVRPTPRRLLWRAALLGPAALIAACLLWWLVVQGV